MRDALRRAWLWFFGPRYYIVMMTDCGAWNQPYAATSRCVNFGGCDATGVFTDHAAALDYWRSRVNEREQPGYRFIVEELHYENPSHRERVLEFYDYNPEVKKAWA
jgi:hypothetical protein